MGITPLGYYEKSYRLMMLPLQNITHVVSPVMHPIFSEYQNDYKMLSSSYEKVVRFLAFIGFPLSVFLYFTAKEITLIIFGNQWMPSVPVFQILSLSVGIQIILSTSGSIFQAANATKSMFISGLISTILNVSGILSGIFIFKSLEAIAWGICISFTINFFQAYLLIYKGVFKLSILSFCKQFVSPLILSVIVYMSLVGASLIDSQYNILVSLALKATIYIVVSLVYIQYTKEYDIYKRIHKSIIRKI